MEAPLHGLPGIQAICILRLWYTIAFSTYIKLNVDCFHASIFRENTLMVLSTCIGRFIVIWKVILIKIRRMSDGSDVHDRLMSFTSRLSGVKNQLLFQKIIKV